MLVTQSEECYADLLEALIKFSKTLQKTSRKTCTQSSLQQIYFMRIWEQISQVHESQLTQQLPHDP